MPHCRPPFLQVLGLALPPAIPAKYSPELQIVVNRMLQQDPDARPSIDQLLALPQLQVGGRGRGMLQVLAAMQVRCWLLTWPNRTHWAVALLRAAVLSRARCVRPLGSPPSPRRAA